MFDFTAKALSNNTGEAFSLISNDIAEGRPLSGTHVFNSFGCSGENISPHLAWKNAPAGTKSFVITCFDPDAPVGWWHWLAFNIPANVSELPTNAGSGVGLPDGAIQSVTDFGSTGYGGACPPEGEVHRYVFTVYALSVDKLELDETAMPGFVGFMAHMNALGRAILTATFTH